MSIIKLFKAILHGNLPIFYLFVVLATQQKNLCVKHFILQKKNYKQIAQSYLLRQSFKSIVKNLFHTYHCYQNKTSS